MLGHIVSTFELLIPDSSFVARLRCALVFDFPPASQAFPVFFFCAQLFHYISLYILSISRLAFLPLC